MNNFEDLYDFCPDIDRTTFEQILEMDDDDQDRDFSKHLVDSFFEQAKQSFKEMEEALEARNLGKLHDLGHFLKGSSATLGLTKVRESCEYIQRYGAKENPDGTPEKDEDTCLSRIRDRLKMLNAEYNTVEKALKDFFGLDADEEA